MCATISRLTGMLMVVSLLLGRAVWAEEEAAPPVADTNTCQWRVAQLTLAEANQVWWGTNLLSVTAFTNLAGGLLGEEVEAVVIHGGLSGASTLRVPSELLEYLMVTGKGILVDTREDSATSGDAAFDENIRTITLRTSYLRLLEGRDSAAGSGSGSVVDKVSLGSTFDVNTELGTYELREVGLGLWDDRLWLVRGLPENEDDEGSVGVQFKKEW